MAYLQNNSAFIPNGLTRYLPHSNQCDETNCSLAKRFGDAESCAQCPIYYDQRPVRSADRTICGGVYRSVSLNDELPNLPPNTYGTLAKRKREKVYHLLCFVTIIEVKAISGHQVKKFKQKNFVPKTLFEASKSVKK